MLKIILLVKAILSICDFFQTFPSFIYLIPVILLFGITDTSVMIAAIVYATVPATRYTVEGLKSVPLSLHEAGTMSGVSRLQRWTNIELPLAFPSHNARYKSNCYICLIHGYSWCINWNSRFRSNYYGSFIKKRWSWYWIYTLGIFVSFMCLAVDNLIRTWANERKKLIRNKLIYSPNKLSSKIDVS